MSVLVPTLGLYGAVLGSLVSIAGVSLPMNLRALSREAGGSPLTFFTPLAQWFARFAPLVVAVAALITTWTPRGLATIAPLAAGVGAVYFVVMLPALKSPPLGPMLAVRIEPWLSRMPKLARYLFKPADALAR